MNVTVALKLYRSSGKLWQFKSSLLDYITHVYLDSGNVLLFDPTANADNINSLKEILKYVETDIALVSDEWHQTELNCKIVNPDDTMTNFRDESHKFAMLSVT